MTQDEQLEHERHVAEKIGEANREKLLQILSAFT